MTRRTFLRAEALARSARDDVTADRIECVECGNEYIGDRENGETCPRCDR